jgi:hypothetical protein
MASHGQDFQGFASKETRLQFRSPITVYWKNEVQLQKENKSKLQKFLNDSRLPSEYREMGDLN